MLALGFAGATAADDGPHVFQVQPQGGGKAVEGLVVVALADEGVAPAAEVLRIRRFDSQNGGKVRVLLVVLAASIVGGGPAYQCRDIVRVQADGFGIIGDRLVKVGLAVERGPVPAKRLGVLLVQTNSLVVVGDRRVVIRFARLGTAPLAKCVAIFRVQPDGLRKGGYGTVVVILVRAGRALLVSLLGGVGGPRWPAGRGPPARGPGDGMEYGIPTGEETARTSVARCHGPLGLLGVDLRSLRPLCPAGKPAANCHYSRYYSKNCVSRFAEFYFGLPGRCLERFSKSASARGASTGGRVPCSFSWRSFWPLRDRLPLSLCHPCICRPLRERRRRRRNRDSSERPRSRRRSLCRIRRR